MKGPGASVLWWHPWERSLFFRPLVHSAGISLVVLGPIGVAWPSSVPFENFRELFFHRPEQGRFRAQQLGPGGMRGTFGDSSIVLEPEDTKEKRLACA